MSWLHIVLAAWVAVGLLAGLAFIVLAVRVPGLRISDVDPNPIAWLLHLSVWILAGLPFVVLVLVMVLIVWPLRAAMSTLGLRKTPVVSYPVRILDQGLEVYDEEGALERFVEWPDVERVEDVFHPPLVYPRLVLRDGDLVALYDVDRGQLAPALEQHAIPFERRC